MAFPQWVWLCSSGSHPWASISTECLRWAHLFFYYELGDERQKCKHLSLRFRKPQHPLCLGEELAKVGQPHSFISGAEGRGGELDCRRLSGKRKLMDTAFLQVDRIFVETRRILLNQNRKRKIPFTAPAGSGPKCVPGKGIFLDFWGYLPWFHHSAASLQCLFTWKWALNWFHRMEPCTCAPVWGSEAPSLFVAKAPFDSCPLTPGASQVVLVVKGPACQCRSHKRWGYDPWVWKMPWRRVRQPTPVFLPGDFHGRRSLVGHKGSDVTKAT